MKKKPDLFKEELKGLGDRIKSLREEVKLKRNQFSKEIGISQHVITAYERGLSKPGFEFFYKAMEKFDADPYYLLSGKGSMFLASREEEEDNDPPLAFIEEDESKTALIEFLDVFKKSKWFRLRALTFYHGVKISELETIERDIKLTETRLQN